MVSDSYLLDTDVIIQWLRGEEPIRSLITELLSKRLSLSWTTVSVAEICAGMRKGEEHLLEKLFLVLDSLSLNEKIGAKAGEYLRRYHASHGVEIADALIAASAFFYKKSFWTLNRRHFPMKDIKFFSGAL